VITRAGPGCEPSRILTGYGCSSGPPKIENLLAFYKEKTDITVDARRKENHP
jgi:hypothetical protein